MPRTSQVWAPLMPLLFPFRIWPTSKHKYGPSPDLADYLLYRRFRLPLGFFFVWLGCAVLRWQMAQQGLPGHNAQLQLSSVIGHPHGPTRPVGHDFALHREHGVGASWRSGGAGAAQAQRPAAHAAAAAARDTWKMISRQLVASFVLKLPNAFAACCLHCRRAAAAAAAASQPAVNLAMAPVPVWMIAVIYIPQGLVVRMLAYAIDDGPLIDPFTDPPCISEFSRTYGFFIM